jgi:hypothetical protein
MSSAESSAEAAGELAPRASTGLWRHPWLLPLAQLPIADARASPLCCVLGRPGARAHLQQVGGSLVSPSHTTPFLDQGPASSSAAASVALLPDPYPTGTLADSRQPTLGPHPDPARRRPRSRRRCPSCRRADDGSRSASARYTAPFLKPRPRRQCADDRGPDRDVSCHTVSRLSSAIPRPSSAR